jgi:hypothetical protein
MKIRHWYLLLCVLGVALPYWQFVPWVIAHGGLNMSLFIRDLFVNRISAFFGMDVLVSAVVLLVFVGTESRRIRIRSRWLPIIAVVLVGVSLGLPLFLYLRQIQIDRATI